MQRHWSIRWMIRWRIVLIAIITFAVGAISAAIIGNLGSFFFISILNLLVRSFQASLIPWILVFISLSACLYLLYQRRILNHALITTSNIIELDDSLLRLLASWIPARSYENELKYLFNEILRDASKEFLGLVHRASILLPNSNGEYLEIWTQFGIPEETVDRVKFYIGSDESKQALRGVAGETFLNRKLIVAHMKLIDSVWRCDSESFIWFTLKHVPAYRSFVCIPIIGPSSDTLDSNKIISLGVVCFDSEDQTVFDTPEAQVVMRVFARRIASALLISKLLSEKK